MLTSSSSHRLPPPPHHHFPSSSHSLSPLLTASSSSLLLLPPLPPPDCIPLYPTPLYPHCTSTVSSLYPHYILNVSLLYPPPPPPPPLTPSPPPPPLPTSLSPLPHCILAVSLKFPQWLLPPPTASSLLLLLSSPAPTPHNFPSSYNLLFLIPPPTTVSPLSSLYPLCILEIQLLVLEPCPEAFVSELAGVGQVVHNIIKFRIKVNLTEKSLLYARDAFCAFWVIDHWVINGKTKRFAINSGSFIPYWK